MGGFDSYDPGAVSRAILSSGNAAVRQDCPVRGAGVPFPRLSLSQTISKSKSPSASVLKFGFGSFEFVQGLDIRIWDLTLKVIDNRLQEKDSHRWAGERHGELV